MRNEKDRLVPAFYCSTLALTPRRLTSVGVVAWGLPMSVQVVGRYFVGVLVFLVAAAYKRATVWHY